MTQDLLWQPWITIKGASNSFTVVQPAAYNLDTAGLEEIIIRLETKNLASNAVLTLQTSPTVSGPWSDLFSKNYLTEREEVILLSTDPCADYIMQRYVRWSATGQTNWSATFQISVKCKELRKTFFRARAIESGEIQPWTTIAGGVATTDSIVPLESSWIDTQGMEKLSLYVEVVEGSNASLFIEKAMSPEGSWKIAETITSAGSTLYTFETAHGVTYSMERFFRWSMTGTTTDWKMCFRINARSWP